jgi:hypothetical protein
MKKKWFIAMGLLFLWLFYACEALTSVADAITNPDAREIYKREFSENEIAYKQWDSVYRLAKRDSLSVPVPYGERGTLSAFHNSVYSYSVKMKAGEMLQAAVVADMTIKRVFIDILEYDGNQWKLFTATIRIVWLLNIRSRILGCSVWFFSLNPGQTGISSLL